MSLERTTHHEARHPYWEMSFSWGQMLAGLIERKVIPVDFSIEGNLAAGLYGRYFRTANGDRMLIWGSPRIGAQDKHPMTWSITIQPTPREDANGSEVEPDRYSFDLNYQPDGDYVVVQTDSQLPLSPEAVEALVGTVATGAPISETQDPPNFNFPPN